MAYRLAIIEDDGPAQAELRGRADTARVSRRHLPGSPGGAAGIRLAPAGPGDHRHRARRRGRWRLCVVPVGSGRSQRPCRSFS